MAPFAIADTLRKRAQAEIDRRQVADAVARQQAERAAAAAVAAQQAAQQAQQQAQQQEVTNELGNLVVTVMVEAGDDGDLLPLEVRN